MKQSPFAARRNFNRYNRFRRGGRELVDADTYYGVRFYDCDIKDKVSRFIYQYGIWEPNVSAQFENILKPGDVVVDIGANIGYYSLLASTLVGEAGKVVAIEAAPTTFAQLSANLAGNEAGNVRAVNVAVAEKPGRLTLYGGPQVNRGATSTVPRDGLIAEAEVPALPLHDILTPDERARVALIKIDVEGGEAPLLQQIIETIDQYSDRVRILAEMTPDWAGAERLEQIFQQYLAAGFAAFAIENAYSDEYYFRWKRPAPVTRISSLPPNQVDVLFARQP